MELDGKVAVVVGASRGIGKAVALALAREGAKVAAVSRTRERLEAAVREIGQAGEAAAFVADVSCPEQVDGAVKAIVERFGRIDILVNSAGVCVINPVADLSPDDFDRMVAVNLKGVFLFCRAVIPHLVRQGGGHIVNIASYVAKVGRPRVSSYCATKFGVVGLSQGMAHELKEHGISVSVICPRPVDTPMRRELFPDKDPSGWMAAEEVADVVVFAVRRRALANLADVTIGTPL
ncbi:MAG: SDR family oxidoreductase [Acetobacteraceae bacterium]|nr:SDR family oxidoreductase [Acetobacteraceae bacterium]